MTDVPIPGVEPIERDLMDPYEWITTTGRVRWRAARGAERQQRCEDCLHTTAQFLGGREFPRAPGLARPASSVRTQAKQQVLLCVTHAQRRIEKENHA